MSSLPDLAEIQEKINYRFKNPVILRDALTHKSFVNENRTLDFHDNERMEFLGDAVLDLVISQILFRNFPQLSEGDLSKKRASIVREESLYRIARRLDLGNYIFLGKGEEMSGGREKSSLLANTLEAVVAAVYLDDGFESVSLVVEDLFREMIEAPVEITDYKSELQEACQRMKMAVPKYRLVSESGPDHEKRFEVGLEFEAGQDFRGGGRSIKEAEQMAAKKALREIFGIG